MGVWTMKQVILIDGKNFCYRHGWTHRDLRYNKIPTGMLYGAITGIARLGRLHPNAVIAFCWDGAQAANSWRHKLEPSYKANRVISKGYKPTRQDIEKNAWKADMNIQIPLLKEFIDMMGFKQFEVSALEADDLIGILSTHLKPMADRILIYSTDRDFYQLMSKRVKVVRDQDKTKQCRPHRTKDVMKEFGITPKEWLKYRAIVGDPGDHIIKVKGMGPKTALKMLAAGVDASVQLPDRFKLKGDGWMYPGNIVIRNAEWIIIRTNYMLSKILTKPYGPELTKEESKHIKDFLRGIQSLQDAARERKDKGYKKMEKFFARYGFDELMHRRREIWDLR